jgi:hypothetical protein
MPDQPPRIQRQRPTVDEKKSTNTIMHTVQGRKVDRQATLAQGPDGLVRARDEPPLGEQLAIRAEAVHEGTAADWP